MPKEIERWQRQKNETARAFAAFCAYRDLGPGRSLDKAWGLLSGRDPMKKAPGRIQEWSRSFQWVRRCEAWDARNAEIQQCEFDARLKQLAHDQADFAVEEFKRLASRVRMADKILDKADAHPITDVVQEQVSFGVNGERIRKRHRVQGVNLAGYAALMKEIRESARRAILGPRDSDTASSSMPPIDDIVWEAPNL